VTVVFLPGESNLLTSGADNALKIWTFDGTRLDLLKSREGHALPPDFVRFHPGGTVLASLASGSDSRSLQMLTTASDGSLRVMHAMLDHHMREFSHKAASVSDIGRRFLTPVVALATSEAREKDWCNVVTAHRGLLFNEI